MGDAEMHEEDRAVEDEEGFEGRITALRSAGFSISRRGFDRDEVKQFLSELADWLESIDLAGSDPGQMRKELALVGQRTTEILSKAEETARELRRSAQANAAETLAAAEAEAARIREEVEAEERSTRIAADSRAEEIIAAAETRAEQMIDSALSRRQALQAVIDDLVERRNEIVADTRRMVGELGELLEGEEADGPYLVEDEADDEQDPVELGSVVGESEADDFDREDGSDHDDDRARDGYRDLEGDFDADTKEHAERTRWGRS